MPIRHQGKAAHAGRCAASADQLKIELAVIVGEKHRLASIAALGDVVGNTGTTILESRAMHDR